MPFDGPAAGIGADTLTRLDLRDQENVKQAEFELSRCFDDASYAKWARTWGASALRCIDDPPEPKLSEKWISKDDHDDVVKAADDLRDAVENAVKALRAIDKDIVPPKLEDPLFELVRNLDTAVAAYEASEEA